MITVLPNSDEEKFSHWEEAQAVHLVVHFVWLSINRGMAIYQLMKNYQSFGWISGPRMNRIGRMLAKNSWREILVTEVSEWAKFMQTYMSCMNAHQKASTTEETLVIR